MSNRPRSACASGPNGGWKHVDIRLNADGTFEVLTDILTPCGARLGRADPWPGFVTDGIKTAAEALERAKEVDEFIESQVNRKMKRTTKAQRAETHYEVHDREEDKPSYALKPEEPPPPPPPPKPPPPPPPEPFPKQERVIPKGNVDLSLFDD